MAQECRNEKALAGGTHSSGNCCRFTRHSLLIPLHGETIARQRYAFIGRKQAIRRNISAKRAPPLCAADRSGRQRRNFGTRFVLISVNCGTATAVRFLHLFKFGLVVLGGRPPGTAGNREIPCCFCVRMPGAPFPRAQGTKKPPGVPIGSLQRSGCRFHGAAMRSGTKTVRRTTRENSKIQPTHHGKT